MSQDSPELEALFDQELAKTQNFSNNTNISGPPEAINGQTVLFEKIGQLARKLNDALREAGRDDIFTVSTVLPESQERLTFVGKLMEEAADNVLRIIDQHQPMLTTPTENNQWLLLQWEKIQRGELTFEEFKTLTIQTPKMLEEQQAFFCAQKKMFTQLLLTQEFQDLAGQTLSKIRNNFTDIEHKILEILALTADDNAQSKVKDFLSGPVYNQQCQESLHSQVEVDELLKNLGF